MEETIPGELGRLASEFDHLRDHLSSFYGDHGSYPELVERPLREYIFEKPNIIYRTKGFLFVHNYVDPDGTKMYYAIEPKLRPDEKEIYDRIREEIFGRSMAAVPSQGEERLAKLEEAVEDTVSISEEKGKGFLQRIRGDKDFTVSRDAYERILYFLKREIVGLGPLEPLLMDKANEDIHVVDPDEVNVDHKVYGIMNTNIDLGSKDEYVRWLRSISERLGDPVSDAKPIVDTTMPDGSRLNIVFSEDVSVEGPTLTIRQYEEEPFSIFRIVQLGTVSPELAAYLWLCLESNVSIAVCGETAGGKTTTMNALTAFIPPDSKIYTAEDTLELRLPHETWQRLLTREGHGEESDVELFHLVKNALRSRPDYVIIGEVRGKEGFNVFQAMQTGHPVMFTFHAGNIAALIYRFTGDPINVPERFFGNLNVVVFQNFARRGKIELRRVTSVHEIEGYSKELGGVVTRKIFIRDPLRDRLIFTGRNNSFVLEDKVAGTLAYEDPRKVYDDLDERAHVIEKAVTKGITGWHETFELINTYGREGKEGLPFGV